MFEARPIRAGLRTSKRMLLTAGHTIRGKYSVQILDGDGKPTLADIVYPDGHVRRLHELPEKPNLILNNWLDEKVNATPSTLRSRLRVGSGSTAPAVTDLALDSQVEIGTTSGDTNSFTTNSIDGDAFYEVEDALSRRVTMTGDRNLTEFGFSSGDATDLNVRNLFRDELDAPITISLLTGKILQVTHTVYHKLPRFGILDTLTVEERDATNALVSSTNYDCELGFAQNGASLIGFIAPQVNSLTGYQFRYRDAADTGVGTPLALMNATMFTISTSVSPFAAFSYVSGTYFVESPSNYLLSVTQGNGTYYAIGLSNYSNTLAGLRYAEIAARFLTPATFVKLDTHELTLPSFRLSWAREP